MLWHNGHPKAIQNVVGACDQVRKAENRADAGKRDRLERTRWMWLTNPVNWTETETQKWESMALERCVTGMAYQMRLVLQGIYQSQDAEEAWEFFGNWWAWVRAMQEQTMELLEPMASIPRMVEGHLEEILAHWTCGLTTAFMEGLNTLLSAVKRKARGYRPVEYINAMLSSVAGRLILPCH